MLIICYHVIFKTYFKLYLSLHTEIVLKLYIFLYRGSKALWSCVEEFRGLAFIGISVIGIPKSLVSIAPDQVFAVNSLHKCFGTTINVEEGNTRYYVTASGFLREKE